MDVHPVEKGTKKMNEIFNKLFNHERYQTISILIIAAGLVFLYSCESKVRSLTDPTIKVNRIELESELEAIVKSAEFKFADLERQEALKDLLFEQSLIAASSGTINPIALLTTIGTIFGAGATIDNIRKRKEIKVLKT